MSHYSRFIIAATLLIASGAQAVDVFFDALAWRATESIDWALNNNLSTPTQIIQYYTVNFDYKPGFRFGIGKRCTWENDLYYTRYYTTSNSAATGNLTSTFLGGKFAQGTNFFNSGQVNFKIDFNMFDWDLSQRIYTTKALVLRPIIGLRGGWINQKAITNFQGTVTLTEIVKNNFRGIGPKAAIETSWNVKCCNDVRYSIFGIFTTSYLYGKWRISDVVNQPTGNTYSVSVGKRNLGAFTAQGLVGLEMSSKWLNLKLGYEIADWFEQYQVLDDGTGARSVDLLLQGFTLGLTFKF